MMFVNAADFQKSMQELIENNSYISNGVEKERDFENFHKQADDLMCRTLRTLGYDKGVDVYEKIPKYYSKGE